MPDDAEAYEIWREAGGRPTPWPRDDAGVETLAALNQVLAPYGLFADLKAYAAAKRYEVEIGGVVVGGLAVRTDRETRSALIEAKAATDADPAWTTAWKLGNGQWVDIGAAQLGAIIPAVAAHRAAAFAREELVSAEIDAGTITTRSEVDAAFGVA